MNDAQLQLELLKRLEYQKGFTDGFNKAMWFARKISELEPINIDYLVQGLNELIDGRHQESDQPHEASSNEAGIGGDEGALPDTPLGGSKNNE